MSNRVLTISEARTVSRWWYATRCPDCGDVVPYRPDPDDKRQTPSGYIDENDRLAFVCRHCDHEVWARPQDLYHLDLAD